MTTPAYLGMMGAPFQVLPEETSELAFEPEEYHARIQKVRRLMAEQKIDLLYVTTPEHVCYLHGFFASWYKANSPMRYPQVYGTAIHVDSDSFIHFDNPSELPLLTMAGAWRWPPCWASASRTGSEAPGTASFPRRRSAQCRFIAGGGWASRSPWPGSGP